MRWVHPLEHTVFVALLPPQLFSIIGPSLVFWIRLHGGPIQFSRRFILTHPRRALLS